VQEVRKRALCFFYDLIATSDIPREDFYKFKPDASARAIKSEKKEMNCRS
jgi:hypothetical protein